MRTHPFNARCRIRSFIIKSPASLETAHVEVAYGDKNGRVKRDRYEIVGCQDRGDMGTYFKYELVRRGDVT